ncbi:hypothetical protein TNCT_239481, partial [Trichonephila clavata]
TCRMLIVPVIRIPTLRKLCLVVTQLLREEKAEPIHQCHQSTLRILEGGRG